MQFNRKEHGMKLPRLVCTLALALVALAASSSATAQTINFKLGAHACGSFNNTYYCDNIPITNVDGSQPNPSNGNVFTPPIPAYVFSDVLYNNRLNGFFFLTNYNLGNGVPHADGTQPNVSSYTVTDLHTTPESYQLEVNVAGLMLDGSGNTYAGTVSYVYTVGTRHCGGGKGGGCSTPWNILGGSGTITVMHPALTSAGTLAAPSRPRPEIGTVYILECYGSGWLPTYTPTGRVGAQGIQVGAQCIAYNTETGTYGTLDSYTWWIPWSTWFFPPAQIPACEVANYSSWCASQLDNPEIQLSTPQHPAL